ncbi:hypothetical protein RA307_07200 [Xanthobacteraceae bacterium Astr-EGSB]|uniref:hypothetical protein n=1 Tax=Astrobacterium formosum TaxID=3069710 RepID=UPI0027B36BBE|nr:hypothetical protein [Xanthobacteraceae bacterium Astr-EGSB]
MPRKQFQRRMVAVARLLSRPTGLVFGHAATGLVLAGLFVGALCGSGSTIGRLLVAPENLAVLAKIFVLHAALFACASFATSTLFPPPGGHPQARRPWPSWRSLRAVAVKE